METILLSIAAFAVIMLMMAIGIIFNRPCLRGSCGGPEVMVDGQPLSCSTCPNRKKKQRSANSSSDAGLKVVS